MEYDVTLSSASLDPRLSRSRPPLRPALARLAEFESRFDALTLIHDMFWDADGDSIVVLAPPLPSYADPEKDIEFLSMDSGQVLLHRQDSHPSILFGDMYRVQPGADTRSVAVAFGAQVFIRPVQPNMSWLFRDKRVLFARNRDNALEWIADWVRFHAVEFGFDAVLMYDNGSTRYAPEDVAAAIRSVPGIETAVVVSWPFRTSVALSRTWPRPDDMWGNAVVFEHARRRFLAAAEVVFQADVDELLLLRSNKDPIEELKSSGKSWSRFLSVDVAVVSEPEREPARYVDFTWVAGEPNANRPKYLVVPSRCSDRSRWWFHFVRDEQPLQVDPEDCHLVHFTPLTTGWLGRGNRRARVALREGIHRQDSILERKLNDVFGSGLTEPRAWSVLESDDSTLLRATAYDLLAVGDVSSAIELVERALELDPYHPYQALLRSEIHAKIEHGYDGQ